MHEFSVARSLLDLVGRIAEEKSVRSVKRVVVRIGVLSGIEPHLLRSAFELLKRRTVAEGSELVIEEEKLRVVCHDCGETSEKEDLTVECPLCGSLSTEVVSGEGMLLKSLEVNKG